MSKIDHAHLLVKYLLKGDIQIPFNIHSILL